MGSWTLICYMQLRWSPSKECWVLAQPSGLVWYARLVSVEWLCYIWAGVNRYFTLCSTNSLAIGGGGHFALYLDGDLWEFCAIFPFTLHSEQRKFHLAVSVFDNSFNFLLKIEWIKFCFGNIWEPLPCALQRLWSEGSWGVQKSTISQLHIHTYAVYSFPYRLYYFWHNISFIMKEQNP